MRRLLFVCTGNTCRSSMAEVLARQAALKKGLEEWEFCSAGTYADQGSPASENSAAAVMEMGLDLSCHRATALTAELVSAVDLVLTMTINHREQVKLLVPGSTGKVFTLLEFAFGHPGNIDDPFGGDLQVYRRAAEQLKKAIDEVIVKLAESHRNNGERQN